MGGSACAKSASETLYRSGVISRLLFEEVPGMLVAYDLPPVVVSGKHGTDQLGELISPGRRSR